ncbi:hypothetical protein IAR55_002176 [Kwoniella newhampshirensis]|uniref:Protein-tyrosine-phosphatase n=1 Tax=Kwoniella newhampshirensis TaxID=1651941 RepID=A0AAW0YTS4_9TREE
MSLVLPFPQPPPSSPHYPLSSRSTTPRPTTPLSAPPTPVNPTHLLPAAMERARSSEGIIPTLATVSVAELGSPPRESRSRDVKQTLLKGEWEHMERQHQPRQLHQGKLEQQRRSEEEKMDIDQMDGDEDGEMWVEEAGLSGGQLQEVGGEESVPLGEPLSQSDQQVKVHLPTAPEEGRPFVWGMPKWGREPERKEVRKGVRLVGMEELPGLVERHSMIDTPSSVLFPWLHGISDDGQKGRDMAAFFGYGPPFEPPPYRGLSVMFCPPHPLDDNSRPHPQRNDTDRTAQQPTFQMHPPRERSETMSTSSESYRSTGTTEGTSPSLGELSPPPFGAKLGSDMEESAEDEADVAMHPCDSKRVSLTAAAKGVAEEHHPLPCGNLDAAAEETSDSESDVEDLDSEDQRPSCILFNALHVHDVFDLPKHRNDKRPARFRPARLPHQINLRNLNIQQIKYASVSDVVLYSKHGAGNGVLEVAEQVAKAQQELWESRMEEFYKHMQDSRTPGEGSTEPVRYGVWVVLEPFWKLERSCPHLVNIDSRGAGSLHSIHTDLFEREARESRAMTRGSEVVEGFWVGNDCDVPGVADDGASECAEMPTSEGLAAAHRKLHELDRKRQSSEDRTSSWIASPATIALRNLLSPSPSSPNMLASDVPSKRTASPSPDQRNLRPRSNAVNGLIAEADHVALECAGSCRTITGQTRNLSHMTDKVIELVYFLRKIVEGRDTLGKKRRVLVHCQDGYTESSIIVLAYIMSSLSISLPEAFLHLQLVAKRSFFLYPSDKPLLRRIDSRLTADRRSRAIKLVNATNATPPSTATSAAPSRSGSGEEGRSALSWRSWGMNFGAGKSKDKDESPSLTVHAIAKGNKENKEKGKSTIEVAKEMLVEQESGGSEAQTLAKIWFEDKRFDGFPSRILPFLYLGNLEHAGNAAMLHALRITHVVSVGESLINIPSDMDPTYGPVGGNTLAAEARAGRISVLDLTDVRDDGNDPLRPVIARACAWIEAARREGGVVLVHCRVGVSRSASIVIAYMMQFEKMGLMDAYMICRARRLNVLIQPNLRFFHELFGWEVELARQEEELGKKRREEAERNGVRDPEALRLAMEGDKRRIMYSWPSFCRDLHCLNRRFLCN